MKTRQDVEELKRNWLNDPCWNLDYSDNDPDWGDYADELRNFQITQESVWAMLENKRLVKKTEHLNCSVELVKYLENLEYRIKELERTLGE